MIGETVSHYRILGKLGSGGMGVVYLAEDTHLARQVAIKFSTAGTGNEAYRTRFLREARAASALNHPHIARIYDYGEAPGGEPFIVMELVSGEDLAHLLRRGPMPLLQTIRIVEEVAEALSEAHRSGIIHRDIKPSNIVIDDRGQVKVLDFGLAKAFREPEPTSEDSPTVESSQTAAGVVLGTPSYMSPEQAREGPLAPRSDLFALGAVLYECLASRPAFVGANSVEILAGVLHVEPSPPSYYSPRVPAVIDAIVAKALAKDPHARYQSAHEMLADLRAARAGMTQPEGQETQILPGSAATSLPTVPDSGIWKTLGTLTGPLRRSRAVLAGTIAIVLAAVAGSWWVLSDRTYQATPEALRWYQEGVTALRDGTYYKASKALEQAVSADPRYALAHARLAEAYLELDLTDKAREEALRASPPVSSPELTRAERSYLQALQLTLTGDLPGAARIYKDLVGRAPSVEKAGAYVDLGRALEKSEKTKDAIDAYGEATRRSSQNPAAWLHLASLYGRQMQPDAASQAFSHAEQLYQSLSNLEGVTEVLYQRAVLANRLGNYNEAKTLLAQALDLSTHIGSLSQQILARLQLSAAEYRATDYTQATSDATQAIDLARSNGLENLTTRGLIDLGNAYFLKGDADEAKKAFTQSLDFSRRFHSEHNEARALFSLGSLAMHYGDLDEAIREVQQSLVWFQRGGYQKETANALLVLARAQRQKGDYDGALQSFDKQLQIGRKLDDASLVSFSRQGSGTVLSAEGRLPEALSAYREAYEAALKIGDKLNVEYDLLDAADIYWRLGRYQEARQALDDAEPSPSRAVSELHDQIRAAMALSQRDLPNAIEFSQRVLSQAGLGADLTIAAKSVLGRAKLASSARSEGLALTADAEQLATKSGGALLLADARLAHAEGLLSTGQAQATLDAVAAAQKWFAGAGNQEAEWRSWLIASGAESALGRSDNSSEYAQKAAQLLASLQQKWDADNYKTYLSRPDIQDYRNQLAKLTAGR